MPIQSTRPDPRPVTPSAFAHSASVRPEDNPLRTSPCGHALRPRWTRSRWSLDVRARPQEPRQAALAEDIESSLSRLLLPPRAETKVALCVRSPDPSSRVGVTRCGSPSAIAVSRIVA